MRPSEMTLRTRFALSMAAIALLLVVPLLIAVFTVDQLRRTAAELRDRDFSGSVLLARVRTTVERIRAGELALLRHPTEQNLASLLSEVSSLEGLADVVAAYELASVSRQVGAAAQSLKTHLPEEYRAAQAGEAALAERTSTDFAAPALKQAERSINAGERELSARTQQRMVSVNRERLTALWLSGVFVLLFVALAVYIAVSLGRAVSRPVADLEKGMLAVAQNDFEYSIDTHHASTSEFRRLVVSFREMSGRLAELERLKAEWISVAAHELKTPLNIVYGNLQLFRDGMLGELTQKQLERCDVMIRQTQSLTARVHKLLDVSRFEAGVGTINPGSVHLRVFLRELEQSFGIIAAERGVRFVVSHDDQLPPEAFWDAERVGQVFDNLLSNAFKFTPSGGEVELSVRAEDELVRLVVRDSGVGISPADVGHVFEKFYQADNQAKASHKGTGLGLAITKELVEAHGGSVTCESTPGVGTAFTITLPLRAVCATAPQFA
jgi:signal transduction histidine kinase